jgi:hypothetical protein
MLMQSPENIALAFPSSGLTILLIASRGRCICRTELGGIRIIVLDNLLSWAASFLQTEQGEMCTQTV